MADKPIPTMVDIDKVVREAQAMSPSIYFNQFHNIGTNSDVTIVLQVAGRSVAVLTSTYGVAKALGQKLTELVADVERETGFTFPTTEDFDKVIAKRSKQ